MSAEPIGESDSEDEPELTEAAWADRIEASDSDDFGELYQAAWRRPPECVGFSVGSDEKNAPVGRTGEQRACRLSKIGSLLKPTSSAPPREVVAYQTASRSQAVCFNARLVVARVLKASLAAT